MFRRGLLILFSVLVTLGFFANSYADDSIEQVSAPVATFPSVVVVIKSANVRAGPGTDFPVISGARVGQRLTVLGCNIDCSWYQLANDCWIAAFLVNPEQPAVPPGGIVLPTSDARLPTVVVSIPITVTGGAIQTTRCPQTLAAVNTYAGPGTFFAVMEVLPAGECVAIVGRNTIGDWFQLSHGMWILAAAVIYAEPIENMPVVDRIFTATPEPPPTPSTPNLTAEEQDYLNFIASQGQVYGLAWGELGNLLIAAGQNPMLIITDEWIIKIATAIALIQVTNEKIRERVPPPRFASAHAEVINAANHFDQAMSLLAEGIDNIDMDKIVAAQSSMEEGQRAIQRATTIIEGLNQNSLTKQGIAAATPAPVLATSVPAPATQGCDPNYEGVCIPINSSDVDCTDPGMPKNFSRIGDDPHDLDRNNDGIACEDP